MNEWDEACPECGTTCTYEDTLDAETETWTCLNEHILKVYTEIVRTSAELKED